MLVNNISSILTRQKSTFEPLLRCHLQNRSSSKFSHFVKDLKLRQTGCLLYLYNSSSRHTFSALPKLRAFADDKFVVTQNMKFAIYRVENIVEKGENAGYQHFLLFP